MSTGMDIGSSLVHSLRWDADRLMGRKCPAVYISIPADDAHRRWLERAQVSYASCEGSLVVIGRPALELAPILHLPCLPVLPQGRLPNDDPVGRQLAAAIIDALLPATAAGERCCLTLPGVADETDAAASREWAFFSRVIRLRGHQSVLISASLATVLAELGHVGFTGIGFTLGGSACSATIAHLGRPLAQAALPRGGDWINEQFARRRQKVVWDTRGMQYVDIAAVQRWIAASRPSLSAPGDEDEVLLSDLYRQLLRETIDLLAARCAQTPHVRTLRHPLGAACAGQELRLSGFPQLLLEVLRGSALPLEFGDVRVADDAIYAVARGCLIHAELQELPAAAAA